MSLVRGPNVDHEVLNVLVRLREHALDRPTNEAPLVVGGGHNGHSRRRAERGWLHTPLHAIDRFGKSFGGIGPAEHAKPALTSRGKLRAQIAICSHLLK